MWRTAFDESIALSTSWTKRTTSSSASRSWNEERATYVPENTLIGAPKLQHASLAACSKTKNESPDEEHHIELSLTHNTVLTSHLFDPSCCKHPLDAALKHDGSLGSSPTITLRQGGSKRSYARIVREPAGGSVANVVWLP